MRASRRNKKNCKTKRRTYKKGGDSNIDREEIAKKIQDYKRRSRTPTPRSRTPISRSRTPTPNGTIQGQEYDDLLRDLGMQPTQTH